MGLFGGGNSKSSQSTTNNTTTTNTSLSKNANVQGNNALILDNVGSVEVTDHGAVETAKAVSLKAIADNTGIARTGLSAASNMVSQGNSTAKFFGSAALNMNNQNTSLLKSVLNVASNAVNSSKNAATEVNRSAMNFAEKVALPMQAQTTEKFVQYAIVGSIAITGLMLYMGGKK